MIAASRASARPLRRHTRGEHPAPAMGAPPGSPARRTRRPHAQAPPAEHPNPPS